MNKVLLCGIQKTGNTWIRFIIFNYFHILKDNADKTLTFDELQEIHSKRKYKEAGYNGGDGYPLVFHTHNSYEGHGINVIYDNYPEFFDLFDKMIYIYRNPFDTCISYWHYTENRVNVDYKRDLKEFTEWFLPKWIHHVKSTRHHADFVVDYDIIREHPLTFVEMMDLITDCVDFGVLEKAIKISSFESIKKMSVEVNQPYGLGGNRYKGFFTRDGRSGQYKEVMNAELIEYVKKECKKGGLEIYGKSSNL